MKLKNAFRAVAAAAVMATASLSASAGYVVLDGWQLNVPGFTPTTTTNIGHLTLGGGLATVSQQINGSGQAFVGANFSESGSIFSATYVTENKVGAGDSGSLGVFASGQIQLLFSGVTGVVTDLNSGGGFHYVFTGGAFQLQTATYTAGVLGAFATQASGSIIGLGGNTGSTAVIGGAAGDSNLLAQVLSEIGLFDFRDSTGTSLKPELLAGNVLLQATTTNTIDANSAVTTTCNFGSGPVDCLQVNVTSEGAVNIVRAVPEPGSVALLGMGLMALCGVRRRKASK